MLRERELRQSTRGTYYERELSQKKKLLTHNHRQKQIILAVVFFTLFFFLHTNHFAMNGPHQWQTVSAN